MACMTVSTTEAATLPGLVIHPQKSGADLDVVAQLRRY